MKEEEKDLEHLPTADDPDNVFKNWMNNINQDMIENMSERGLIHMNSELARKCNIKDNPHATYVIKIGCQHIIEEAMKHRKSKHSKVESCNTGYPR